MELEIVLYIIGTIHFIIYYKGYLLYKPDKLKFVVCTKILCLVLEIKSVQL